MITKLRLENFKGFKRLEVPETSTITLIGGQNNIGKTSLLEGIFLFYDTGDPGMFMRHLAWRGINVVSSIDPDIAVAPIFYNFDFKQNLKIAVSDAIYQVVMEVAFNVDAVDRSINIDLADSGAIPQIKSDLTSRSSYDFKIDYKIDGQDTQSTHLLMDKLTIRTASNDGRYLQVYFRCGKGKACTSLVSALVENDSTRDREAQESDLCQSPWSDSPLAKSDHMLVFEN